MHNTVLLFPGQGSQEPGMGKDLAESDHEIMELWKVAERASGIDLRGVYWDGDERAMADTRNLQPALTVVNLALWRALSAKVNPVAAAGHSLGEFSAMAAAGVLSFDATLELVSLRGRLMGEADPEGKGSMAAVLKLTLPQVEALVAEARGESGEVLVVANHNTPAQFVVSGSKGALEILQGRVKTAKGRALPLAVSGAFHSPLMQDAAREFAGAVEAISKTAWNTARFPIYCNAAPTAQTDPDALKTLMRQQMTSSVHWIDTVARQWDDGGRVFVECGPKGLLGKMVGPILSAHAPAAAGSDTPAWRVFSLGSLQQVREFSLTE